MLQLFDCYFYDQSTQFSQKQQLSYKLFKESVNLLARVFIATVCCFMYMSLPFLSLFVKEVSYVFD
jgi:hypothetical protein